MSLPFTFPSQSLWYYHHWNITTTWNLSLWASNGHPCLWLIILFGELIWLSFFHRSIADYYLIYIYSLFGGRRRRRCMKMIKKKTIYNLFNNGYDLWQKKKKNPCWLETLNSFLINQHKILVALLFKWCSLRLWGPIFELIVKENGFWRGRLPLICRTVSI